jgi:hypothetical protein
MEAEVFMNGFPSPGSDGGSFNFMFTLVPVLIFIVFIVIIGVIIFNLVGYLKNARSPKESTYARVAAKRMDVRQFSQSNNETGAVSNSSRTYYYITLEFDNGSRKEYLDVKELYGLVAEGDTGYAQIQGEWIVAFERTAG